MLDSSVCSCLPSAGGVDVALLHVAESRLLVRTIPGVAANISHLTRPYLAICLNDSSSSPYLDWRGIQKSISHGIDQASVKVETIGRLIHHKTLELLLALVWIDLSRLNSSIVW